MSAYEKLSETAANPKQGAGFFSRLTLTWLNSLLALGHKRALELEDLPPLLEGDRSCDLTARLVREWKKSSTHHDRGPNGKPRKRTRHLLRAVWRITSLWDHVYIAVLVFVSTVARLIQPMFLFGLVASLMGASPSTHLSGYYNAAGVSLASLIQTVTNCHCDYRSRMLGIQVRAAVLGLIYHHVLQLPHSDLMSVTSGHVMNLVSNDVQRCEAAVRFLPFVLVSPLAILVSCGVLFFMVGLLPTVTGLVFLILIIACQSLLAGCLAVLRERSTKFVDFRIKIVKEIIQAIRTVKMFAWEKHFEQVVGRMRRREIPILRKISGIVSTFMALQCVSTNSTSLIIFATYLMEGYVLRTDVVFLVFSYMTSLRDYVTLYLGKMLSGIMECNVSVERIQHFLETVDSSLEGRSEFSRRYHSMRATDFGTSDENDVTPTAPDFFVPPREEDANVTPISEQYVTPSGKQVTTPSSKQGVTPKGEQNVTPSGKQVVTPSDKLEVTPGDKQDVSTTHKGDVTPSDKRDVTPSDKEVVTTTHKGDVTPSDKRDVTPSDEQDVTPSVEQDVTEDWKTDVTNKPKPWLDGDKQGRATSPLVVLSNASCYLTDKKDHPVLDSVNLHMEEPQLVVITGPVGSGKSTLLLLMLGELSAREGHLHCRGHVAYVSQTPWTFSGSIRENILFNRPYETEKYWKVVKATALQKDLERFPDGDQTLIGEHGIVLSGGQRARVELARAAYSEASLYLLDDPLSAVDAEVGRHIFEQCIRQIMCKGICILVTHQPYYYHHADRIVLMERGSIEWQGTYEESLRCGKQDFLHETHTEEEGRLEESEANVQGETWQNNEDQGLKTDAEDRQTGSVSRRTYWRYFRASLPPILVCFLFVLTIVVQGTMFIPDWWMSQWESLKWTNASDRLSVYIYMGLIFGAMCVMFIWSFIFSQVTINSARNLHRTMLSSLLKAQVFFFDTNPTGRIINRFSKDVGFLDESFPSKLPEVVLFMIFIAFSFIVPAVVNYWVILDVVPLFLLSVYYGKYCIKVSRDIARLEAASRSPLYSQFSLAMDGLVSIRAYRQQSRFMENFYRYQDQLSQTWFVSLSLVPWLNIRIDLLSVFFVTVVTFSAVLTSAHAGLTGLSVVYCTRLLITLPLAVRLIAYMETTMVSVERILAYTRLDPEPGYMAKPLPLDNWPKEGRVTLRNLSLVYYPGGPEVLKKLSFEVGPGEKLGIAGRTGAGKSSIVASLMRMPEPSGEIIIDGLDVLQLDLQSYRSRISVIPQNPVLFSGTLRSNLDPEEKFPDVQLWGALESVHLGEFVQGLEEKLLYRTVEGGANFSVGERQLLCLARALLQGNRVILLDEATANVDFKTDSLVQETIRSGFANCTVITIAHRVNTIRDYDKVLVLDQGSVVEFGEPNALLRQEDSKFRELCRRSNLLHETDVETDTVG